MQYILILTTILTFDLLWWGLVDRRLRGLGRAGRWVRVGVGAFAVVMAAFPVTLFVLFMVERSPELWPFAWPVVGYLWLLGMAPGTLMIWGAWWGVTKLMGTVRGGRRASEGSPGDESPDSAAGGGAREPGDGNRVSRRAMLEGMAFAIVPPFVTGGLAGYSIHKLGTFRVRREELRLAGLPADLDGVTIAHVTDLHIGRFLPAEAPRLVADAVNGLGADLVVFTGDLLDVTCWDGRKGVDFLRRLDPRSGLAVIQGNHDGMVDADYYEGPMREAGMPLLINEASVHRIPGRATAVQFLGLSWGELLYGWQIKNEKKPKNRRFRVPSDEWQAESIDRLAGMRQAGAYPVLLAHHPHAFDRAADAGVGLTLVGHTHGGQIMLTDRIGAGPMRFKYWTGVYERGGAKLVVNNGVGNWFPFRMNAPQEVVHVTLRRGFDAVARTSDGNGDQGLLARRVHGLVARAT